MEEIIKLATALSGAPLSVLLMIALAVVVKWWRDDIKNFAAREITRQAREDELYAQNSALLREAVAGLQRVADALD